MSPTIDRVGLYRFFFYSGDRSEPPHMHVESERKMAKFWLNPIVPHPPHRGPASFDPALLTLKDFLSRLTKDACGQILL
ncbi:DUF4160 domain-containing protein [Litorilinea aerophila]|uniref:DUF4160 domain-containing protein n=1 Tax=Litorilinea aerophila TaxID=1204385 RepID=A0A540V9T1_9CHLR